MRTPRNQPGATPLLGSIHAGEIMPLREFLRRMGLSRKSWAELSRRGFPSVKAGKQVFIIGDLALGFFRKLAEQHTKGGQP
jgi:hypothetical protein